MKTNLDTNDKAAITILRRAYDATEFGDLLFNARMYLADRERYARMKAEVAAREMAA